MNIEELKSRLEINGLGSYFEKLQPLVRNTIRLYLRQSDEDNIAIGQTKIGGKPDLPSEIQWVTEINFIETKEKKFLVLRAKSKRQLQNLFPS